MKKFLTTFLFGILCWNACAQKNLPNSCMVSLPKLLDRDLLKDSDIQELYKSPNWGQDNKTNNYWRVYSDRANNITYKSPESKSKRLAVLDFNEELRIAKIEKGFALVYVEQYSAAIYPRIIKPLWKGWVSMDHLLLWSSCPTDGKGIYHKAFLMVNLDEFTKAKEKELGMVFDDPMAKSNPQKVKTGKGFFFIVKEDKESGMVLLAKSTILTGKTSQELYGWVNKATYVPLNHRVFLEPNWNPDVVEKLKGSKVGIYRGNEKILDFMFGKTNDLGQEKTKYRMSPNEMRYPLLEDNKNQYRVIAFASTGVPEESGKSEAFLKKYLGVSIPGNYIHAFNGYTDKNDPQTGLDYWQPVILISQLELGDLLHRLQPVMAAAEGGSEDRRPFIDAMKELIRTLYGNIDEKEMMGKDTREVMALVAGLNVKSEALSSGRTLMDIGDNKVVSQDEFATMISDFQNKYIKLDRIKNGYKYSIKIVGDTWYWIPVQDLP